MRQNEESNISFSVIFILSIIIGTILIGVIAFPSLYKNLDEIEVVKEGHFYIETLTFTGHIVYIKESPHRWYESARKNHDNMIVFVNELDETISLKCDDSENYVVDENIIITRKSHYIKPGIRVFNKDSIEKVE